MTMELNNRVIILTGAGGGIGSASVKLLVEHGAHVVCVDQLSSHLLSLMQLQPLE